MNISTNVKLAAAFGLGLALAGCVDPEARRAQIDAADHQDCMELGFKPGTEQYGNCRLKLREVRAQRGDYDSPVRFGVGVGVGSTF